MGPTRRALLRSLAALGASSALWLPAAHLPFAPRLGALERGELPPLVQGLLGRHMALWERASSDDIAWMRQVNAEWDFMGRTFLVMALASLSLGTWQGAPDRARLLAVMDRILSDTLDTEADQGLYYFLMPYALARPWVQTPPRSLFLDGEIALMLGARCLVEPLPRWTRALEERLGHIIDRMQAGPVLSAESYPDECWTFCNTAALAALVLADAALGTDHRALGPAWVASARQALIDPTTGMLVSSFTLDGRPLDGPEGSSIWFAAHCLDLVDPAFASDQYDRARSHLGRTLLGFGWGREWPSSWQGPQDVDSGPIVPVLQASAGSSGHALLAARSFGDERFFHALSCSLGLAAFPMRDAHGGTSYLASNQVGDAVILYALLHQGLWGAARARL